MLRVMLVNVSTHSIRQGLSGHFWSEDELNSISNDLAAVDLMADFTFGISSERALQNGMLDHVRANPTVFSSYVSALNGNPLKPPKWSWATPIPRGWFAQNQRHLNEWYDEQIAEIATAQDRAAIWIPATASKCQKLVSISLLVRSSIGRLYDERQPRHLPVSQIDVDLCVLAAGALPSSHRRVSKGPARTHAKHPVQTSA
jgi:hypothetical protein